MEAVLPKQSDSGKIMYFDVEIAGFGLPHVMNTGEATSMTFKQAIT